MACRDYCILLLIGIIAFTIAIPTLAQPPSARPEPERGRPRACFNHELLKTIRIIEQACSESQCDFKTIKELDSRVDKANLLAALRDPNLYPVHIFFPSGEANVTRSFDWLTIKRDQLESLRYVDDPTNTVVFVLGRTSSTGPSDINLQLARERMTSVMSYLKNVLRIQCRQFYGAWLPESTLELYRSDANFLNIPERDYRLDDSILNQVVHVFIFPCADLL